ncbi:UNVERIFIED_CONTAM: hypothetical protein K2H54_060347 [Gekko kuhli]
MKRRSKAKDPKMQDVSRSRKLHFQSHQAAWFEYSWVGFTSSLHRICEKLHTLHRASPRLCWANQHDGLRFLPLPAVRQRVGKFSSRPLKPVLQSGHFKFWLYWSTLHQRNKVYCQDEATTPPAFLLQSPDGSPKDDPVQDVTQGPPDRCKETSLPTVPIGSAADGSHTWENGRGAAETGKANVNWGEWGSPV